MCVVHDRLKKSHPDKMDKFNEGLVRPTIIRLVKNILDNYPDNGQILKELIQNAEDAGATEVIFLLDEGEYGTSKLYCPDLAQFQGPALYAYNNAEFTDADWAGIRRLNDSIKSTDERKIGRFGVGFKSVFHMTDLPGVMTGYGVGFIDPHERYFNNSKEEKSSCKLWDLQNPVHHQEIARWTDQFKPFLHDLFNSTDDTLRQGYKNKTIFRFPLRDGRGEKSDISDKVYNSQTVLHLFEALSREAHDILLFLTNLQQIKICKKNSKGVVTLLTRIEKRVSNLKSNEINIKVTCETGSVDNNSESNWLQHFSTETESADHRINEVRKKLSASPIVGVAINLDSLNLTTDAKQEICNSSALRPSGRIFCYLPLEAESSTGLHVHVHGSFAVDTNRSKIKWRSADQDLAQVIEESLLWNQHIVNKLLPRAMVELAKIVHTFGRTGRLHPMHCVQIIYSIMPDLKQTKSAWKTAAENFYKLVKQEQSRIWFSMRTFDQDAKVIAQRTIFDCWNDKDPVTICIRNLLETCQYVVVSTPSHVLKALQDVFKNTITFVTQDLVCTALKSEKYQDIAISDDDRLKLLEYLLRDLDKLERIVDVKLLPLDDGSWVSFQRCSTHQSKVIIPSLEHPQSLLPGLDKYFLRSDLPDAVILESFKKLASKGSLQLVHFNLQLFLQHLTKVPGICGSPAAVRYTAALKMPHLNPQYLEVLWRYLRPHFSNNLGQLENLHIVPIDSEMQHLAVLSKEFPMLVNDESVDPHVMECCRLLGITIINDLPGFVRDCDDVMGVYIMLPKPAGVLECLRRVGNLTSAFNAIDDFCKISLCKFFGSTMRSFNAIPPIELDLLRKLPIFRTLDGSGFRVSHFECANAVKVAVLKFPTGIQVPELVLLLDGEESRFLGKMLNLQILSDCEVVRNHIFRAIRKGNVYDANRLTYTMCEILNEFKDQLINPDFLNEMRELEFITTSSGKLRRPRELYDPSDLDLVHLFEGIDKFPVGVFAKPEFSHLLMQLGLNTCEVLLPDLMHMANLIHNDPLRRKAHIFMKVMEIQGEKIFRNQSHIKAKKELQKLSWVSAEDVRPGNYPSDLAFVSHYSAPSQVCASKYACIVGSVKPTVSAEKWPNLSALFDWNIKEPDIEEIVDHLRNLIVMWEKSSSSPANDESTRIILTTNVQRMCDDIYTFLEALGKRQAATGNEKSGYSKRLEKLFSNPSIFIEGHFIPTANCVIQFDHGQKCLPWLSDIPKTMAMKYPTLLITLRVRSSFEISDYTRVLKSIHNIQNHQPLADFEHDVVYRIAQCLSSAAKERKKPFTGTGLFLPDDNRMMRPVSELWINNGTIDIPIFEQDSGHRCDSSIPVEVAIDLGVRSISQQFINPYMHQIGQPFGQKEKLISRLRHILQTTPFGLETFKELIQNADDAGASKIHFILDSRHLPDKKVFEEGWKSLQGPALCIFNDKSFTPEDLQGIQDLGEGSKENRLSKIGQYGVGFNCVYHLTDVPAFLTDVNSEKILCALDPTLSHIEIASSDSPGAQYRNIDSLKDKYPDVFVGYLEEDYGQSLGGTLFRLPLRLKASEISDNVVTVNHVQDCLEQIKQSLHGHLLFVNNIREISIRKVNEETGRVEDFYTIKSELSSTEETKKYDAFQASFQQFADGFKKSDITKPSFREGQEIIYQLKISDSDSGLQKWQIVQRFGVEATHLLPENILKLHIGNKLTVVPRGGVAYRLPSHKNASCHDKTTIYTKEKVEKTSCRVFCYLPLPGQIQLPVHVNGHFFLDNDSRRQLLNEESAGQRKGWNQFLLEQVVTPAYYTLICKLKELCESSPSQFDLKLYLSAFPEVPTNEMLVEKVISTLFYKIIARKKVLPAQNLNATASIEWLDAQSGYFDLLPASSASASESKSTTKDPYVHDPCLLRAILLKTGFRLYDTSRKMHDNFKAAGVPVKNTEPQDVLAFYAGKTPDIFRLGTEQASSVSFSARDSIVRILTYCSEWKDFKQHLLTTPLLVTQNGSISIFSKEDKKYASDFSSILPHALAQFAHGDVMKAAKLNAVKDVHLCRRFTVSDFVKLLPDLLRSDIYRGHGREVPMSTLLACVPNFEANAKPSHPWLEKVWTFLEDEYQRTLHADENRHKRANDICKRLISDLDTWCLLSVHASLAGRHEQYVVPVDRSSRLMTEEYMKENIGKKLFLILVKLGFRVVQNTRGGKNYNKLIHQLVGEKSQPASTYIVQELIDSSRTFCQIDPTEQRELVIYLTHTIHEWQNIPNAVATLKSMPFYSSMSGESVTLDSQCYVLLEASWFAAAEIRHGWIAAAEIGQGITFLKYDPETIVLLKRLGCIPLTEIDAFCEIIFKQFPFISDAVRFMHLDYIRKKWFATDAKASTEEAEKLSKKLVTVPFLYNIISEKLECASAFHSPKVSLFKLMKEKCCLPPTPFDEEIWNDFLMKCGLTVYVSHSLLKELANQIAEEARTNRDASVHERSNQLMRHILEKLSDLSHTFCNEIKCIPFIFPHDISPLLESLHPPYGFGMQNCIAFKDSYLFECTKFVWTVRSILPEFQNSTALSPTYREQLQKKLQINAEPSEDDLVKHLVAICLRHSSKRREEEFAENPEKDREENEALVIKIELYRVLKELYNKLSSIKLSDASINEINGVECILIDNSILVRPNLVVFNAPWEIKPYLHQLPSELIAHYELWKQLGIPNESTTSTYIRVLTAIRSSFSDSLLSHEATEAAHNAVKGLFSIVTSDISVAGQIYLPGHKGLNQTQIRLYESNDLVFRNNRSLHLERLTHFQRPFLFVRKELHTSLESKLKEIPSRLRPLLLSEVVMEMLSDTQQSSASQYAVLVQRFRSQEFLNGIRRLFLHANTALDNFPMIEANLRKFKLHCRKNLTTYLVDSITDNRIEGSEEQQSYFSSESNVYLDDKFSVSISKDVLNTQLAEALNGVMGGLLERVLHLIPPIINCEIEDISKQLDDLKVHDCCEKFFDCVEEPEDWVSEPELESNAGNSFQSVNSLASKGAHQLPFRRVEQQDGNRLSRSSSVDNLSSDIPHGYRSRQMGSQRRFNANDAKKWIKQAEYDLKSAENDTESRADFNASNEWVCYKCHQAAEKAIKAMLMQSGKDFEDRSHDIKQLATDLGVEVQVPASRLHNLLVNHSRMRYPYDHESDIPHGIYTISNARNAQRFAKEIVNRARVCIGL